MTRDSAGVTTSMVEPGGTVSQVARRVAEVVPDLISAGTYEPPFRALGEQESQAVIANINDAQADIIWVAPGSPKQVTWMAGHLGKIDAPVMIGVGAAFDFIAGTKPHAPRWVHRSGLE